MAAFPALRCTGVDGNFRRRIETRGNLPDLKNKEPPVKIFFRIVFRQATVASGIRISVRRLFGRYLSVFGRVLTTFGIISVKFNKAVLVLIWCVAELGGLSLWAFRASNVPIELSDT